MPATPMPCPIHGTMVLPISQAEADELGIEHGCPEHNTELKSRPDPSTMTRQERASELRSLDGPMLSGWDVLRQRLDALVGRPLFTHELADLDVLEHEILQDSPPSMAGIMAKFPHDKPVFTVDPNNVGEAAKAIADFIKAFKEKPNE